MLVLVSSATPAAAVGGGTSQAGFTTPLALPGSDGFGEPSIVSGNGRLVVTAPNGLLTTATTDQPSPLWISSNGGSSFQGPIYPQDAGKVGPWKLEPPLEEIQSGLGSATRRHACPRTAARRG